MNVADTEQPHRILRSLVEIKMNDDGVRLSNIIIVITMKCKSFPSFSEDSK